jgi:hypothetical protein
MDGTIDRSDRSRASTGLDVTGDPHEAQTVTRLRSLATWYRAFAKKADAPWIWEARLRQAAELDLEADLLAAKQRPTSKPV